ncbi:hypothetical protein KF707_15005 [Candidatus Obscuribacterales bacterium]|jgi:hypothetical protein|nr:hypothetical protein [Candidatus Obscuribacterales bacterium]MBX3137530.1 hypothetical protein [Candidatus Obscuribacterales bacterium]MBX3154051.1 hypothetical protein [Candidatus Obscuribacterales bacterium]
MSIFENFGENKGQQPKDAMSFRDCIFDAFNHIKESYELDRATAVNFSANSSFIKEDLMTDAAYADI